MTATIQKNKSDTDGKISTAQTTATQALDGLSTKVSQTEYNTKTGQLQTDLTATTQTANQAKTDIVSIKQKDGEQDAKMNLIVSDVNGTKQTVSILQTIQGKQSGDISTLQQRADGFEATVTKVNNLSVGGRNYILDTGNPKTQTSDGTDSHDLYNSARFYSPLKNWGVANGDYIISFDWTLKTALSSDMQASIFFNQSPWQQQFYTVQAGQLTGHVELKFKLSAGMLTTVNDVTGLTFRIMSQMASGNAITYSNLFMKSGTITTTWTPAPEDLSSATAKAQLTADNATLVINNYKTDADGRIRQAQADIKVNADAISTKVAKTDYDKKTGDLTTSVNNAQQTADSATKTIGTYKESNDKRVSAAETNIKANTDAISLTVSKTEMNNVTGTLKSDISTLQQRADGFDATVTKVNNLSVGGRNLLTNTNKDVSITAHTTDTWPGWANIDTGFSFENGKTYTFSTEAKNSTDKIAEASIRVFEASTNTQVGIYTFPADGKRHSVTFTIPNDSHNYHLLFYAGHAGIAPGVDLTTTYHHPKLEVGNIATDWTPAPEDVDSATAKAQLTADNAALTISNYKQDADGRISANSADIVTNANAIKQKVAQSDYDANNTNLTSRLTTVETTANGTATTVSNLQQTVNSLGKTNLINNSEFIPDLQGWSMSGSGTYTAGDYDYSGAVLVLANTGGGIVNLYSSPISLNGSSSITISWKLNYYIFSVGTNGSSYIYLQYLDSSLNPIPNVFIYPQNVAGSSGKGWTNYIVNNFTLTNMPAGAKYIRLVVDARENGSKIGINKPMLTLGTSVGAYVAGAYNNNAALAQVKMTADSISNFVRDSSGNISSQFQTALSKTSIMTGSTLATSIQKQTATQISSAITDNNGKIISLINQDASGVTIAAKKLTVSADTTFLGTNWLNGAIIKNASIGGAQIAKASITDANILNLDVNKISGEVANFIRAYWDGQYGSTSITSEGMTVTAGVTTTVFDENGMQLNKSNRSVGRIGVNDLYQDNSKKGLYFGLEATGDFMAWGAQNYAGNPYTTKLSWFRAGAVPSNLPGLIEGFNFEDNVAFINPVEMRGGIKLQGANDRLLVRASNLNGGSYPTFGGPSAYFVYAGSDIYLSSNGTAINLTKIAKAFGGIRTAAIPTGFNSNGTATGWYNVDMG